MIMQENLIPVAPFSGSLSVNISNWELQPGDGSGTLGSFVQHLRKLDKKENYSLSVCKNIQIRDCQPSAPAPKVEWKNGKEWRIAPQY